MTTPGYHPSPPSAPPPTAAPAAAPTLALRDARPEDAPVLAAAEQEIARTPGRLVSRPHELSSAAYERTIRAVAASGRGRYLVAEEAGVPVGHAVLEPMGLEGLAHVVRLTIAVHEGRQGRGIGRALLGELLAWARSAPHVAKVELNVRAGNARAIALYRALGFVEEGRLRRRVRFPDGTYEDDLSMAWFPEKLASEIPTEPQRHRDTETPAPGGAPCPSA